MVKTFRYHEGTIKRLLIFLIVSAVMACYIQTLNNGFVWDDHVNFTDNFHFRGVSPPHLYWMFTTFHDANYHPLTWMSVALDYVLWGMNPAGYHLTNLLLHALNAVSLFFLIELLLKRTTARQRHPHISEMHMAAAAGALFFALHPLRVETVSWISTRGDLLCGFFYILTIVSYIHMNESKERTGKRIWFLTSVLFFLLSLISRAWGITLPLVLLTIDVYPLHRLPFSVRPQSSDRTIWIEKIPFLLLALGASILAFMAKKTSMLEMGRHGILARCVQAGYGLSFYLGKTVVPARLSPFYLLDKHFDPMAPRYILGVFITFAVIFGLVIIRRKSPWAISAFICYALIVSPLLGIVQSGPQIAADRYTYISCLPFSILVGAGIFRLCSAWEKERLSSPAFLASVIAMTILLAVLSILSFRQVRVWRNDRTLLDHILKLDPSNYVAYYNRGVLNQEQGRLSAAITDYNRAIHQDPEYVGAYYNRGVSYESLGDIIHAMEDYSEAIRLNPENVEAYNNRGVLKKKQGDFSGALSDFNTAIQIKPSSPEAYANRAMILMGENHFKAATRDLKKALKAASTDWPYYIKVKQMLIHAQKRLEKK